MRDLTKKTVDWENIERGVPITNDNYFVRHDKDTGLIYDDRGGYIHQHNCFVDNRREITWIQHNQSSACPSSSRDIVLVETLNGELCMSSAYLVIWDNVRQYRVVRQKSRLSQADPVSSEIKKTSNNFQHGRTILTTLVMFAAALLI